MRIGMIGLGAARQLVLALVLVGASACAGGKSGGGSDAGPQAEKCVQPGGSETGCSCSAEQPPGHRECQQNFTWTACQCPAKLPPSGCQFVGQPVECNPCPGETKGRMTTCLQGGTFDCACPMK